MGNSNSLKHHLENAQKTGVCALPKRGLTEVRLDNFDSLITGTHLKVNNGADFLKTD